MVGELLKYLDDLDRRQHHRRLHDRQRRREDHLARWRHPPFRGEKDTNWEGAFRVPTLIRWPGVIKPGTVVNDIFSARGLDPDAVAAAAASRLMDKLLKGHEAGGKTFKVHLDGYNLMPFLKGEAKESPRKEFVYLTTTATWSPIATSASRTASPSSTPRAWTSGAIR